MNTRSTSKGKQDLINAEATCITKVLDDGTDTGLLEVLNQSQLITKQQRGVLRYDEPVNGTTILFY